MSRPPRRSLERLESRHLLSADSLLSGTVWFDANQNATGDLDEVGLAAVQVYLDLNGDGQLGIDEPATFTLADDPLTPEDESGYYEFANLEPGEYQVRTVLESGLEQTFPHAIPVMEDLVVNGSFESELDGWINVAGADNRKWLSETPTSTTHGLCADGHKLLEAPSPRAGDRVAYSRFNAFFGSNTSLLYQEVDLTNTSTATLHFQYRVQWNHTCGMYPTTPEEPHTFSYQIRDADDGEVLFENELSSVTSAEESGDTGWNHVIFPLDSYTGRSIEIVFVSDVITPMVQYNSIELDAVQVLAPTSTEAVGFHTVQLGPGESQGAVDFGVYSSQPLNSAPVLDAPELITIDEDGSLPLAGLLDVTDADAAGADLQLDLSVDVGELVLVETDGVTVVSGTASGDSQFRLLGNLAALQTALDNLTFLPSDDFHGNAKLTLFTSDLGHSGLGGPMSDELAVTIEVQPVNDPPQLAFPIEPILAQEGTASQTIDVSNLFSDVDVITSGDLLTVEVTGNTNETLVTTSWVDGDLVLSFASGLSGEAVLMLTAFDLDGASAEFLLDVTVLATSRISLNLARPDELAEVGQTGPDGSSPAATFHEWEDAAAELWITIQNDLPDGAFDVTWAAESNVSWIYQAEVIANLGTVSSVTSVPTAAGTHFQGRIVGVDLTGFSIGDRVLLATIRLPKNVEDPVGVPYNVEGAYASPTAQSGLTLVEASIPTMQQDLAVEPTVPGHFLPVIYDADDNGAVGLSDFIQFVGSFGLPTDSENLKAFRFDYDRSGRVGLSDFASFVRFFGARKGSDHEITVPDLLGEEPSDLTMSLEGEPIESHLAPSTAVPMGTDEAPFFAWLVAPRETIAADEPEEKSRASASDSLPIVSYGEPLNPVILDALWRDETWGWGEDELDATTPADESLEQESLEWSEF